MAQMKDIGEGGYNLREPEQLELANKVETMILYLGTHSLLFFSFTHQLLYAWVGKN